MSSGCSTTSASSYSASSSTNRGTPRPPVTKVASPSPSSRGLEPAPRARLDERHGAKRLALAAGERDAQQRPQSELLAELDTHRAETRDRRLGDLGPQHGAAGRRGLH